MMGLGPSWKTHPSFDVEKLLIQEWTGHVQWNLRIEDTWGKRPLSLSRRLSLSWRFYKVLFPCKK